jgi:hypothetical protein
MTKKGESNSSTDSAISVKEGRSIDTNNSNGKEDSDGSGSEVQLMSPNPVMIVDNIAEALEQQLKEREQEK